MEGGCGKTAGGEGWAMKRKAELRHKRMTLYKRMIANMFGYGYNKFR